MTRTEFLAARYDEEEAAAKACQSPSPWKAATHPSDHWIVTDATGDALIYDEGTPTLEEAAHIALHDPARVLREVEAKRKILAEHAPLERPGTVTPVICRVCWTSPKEGPLEGDAWPCFTVASLAAVWSDHPDYRQEWA